MRIFLAVIFAGAVAIAARRAGSLTTGGALAAWTIGAAVFAALGWPGAAVLFAFFLPSSLLTRLGRARKQGLVDTGKAGPRDAWQVAANGGAAAIAALLAATLHAPAALWAFAGAFAAASADTWATEIGTLARGRPRSILTFRTLAPGLSGGITLQGTAAQAAGALAVAGAAAACGIAPWWPVAAAGFTGALLDSVLGAGVQALRWCPVCRRHCETNPHVCGAETTLARGFAWMENDAVNAAATIGGALVAAALALV